LKQYRTVLTRDQKTRTNHKTNSVICGANFKFAACPESAMAILRRRQRERLERIAHWTEPLVRSQHRDDSGLPPSHLGKSSFVALGDQDVKVNTTDEPATEN